LGNWQATALFTASPRHQSFGACGLFVAIAIAVATYTQKNKVKKYLFMDNRTAAVGAANTSYGVTRGALALRFSQGSCPKRNL